ncbi:MAG: rhodanese-like domain-containing protein [Bacteroidales bacterium]|nr:rhodanese-like domain-containing protein [Bacteroidales bacterium]MBR1950423.1 rhodanese-like domain-containing protein [Bacteroidales bacterium]MBR2438270.1 rhodanese-like domain-containing protein [Bacteroidales bacterium]MBR4089074.1 rhodanese-like domain-containing protein [Bacteroidales bacterium]
MKRFLNLLAAVCCIWLAVACNAPAGKLKSVEKAEFAQIIGDGSVVLLDVRTPQEFAQGHIVGAINIDVKDSLFISNVQRQVAPGSRVAVYCRSGRRSMSAAQQMVEKGYDVVNLKGGFLAWEESEK